MNPFPPTRDAAAEDLPWLIRRDKFVDGQTHDGHEDIVVRSNNSQTSLNEAVALDLLAEAGLPSQASAPARFSVNGSDQTLRLIIEHPDDDGWYESVFSGAGAIYKSESTGDWSYRGDDPDSYNEVFDQEGGSDVADLTPLIALLKFINESDDATFEAELADYLDVDSFATYLAMMELVDNFDDIDGPGNNSYLWWDAETGRFTVVPWDLNLAFGTMGGGPGGPMGGGPGGGIGSGAPGAPPIGEMPELPQEGQITEAGRAGFGRSNVLVTRFHANETFEALYQKQLEQLRTDLFESGRATEILETRTQVLIDQATDLVDEDTIHSESEAIASRFSG